MARLTHARLFGADDPYVERSPEELLIEINSVRQKYRDQDNEFMFETRAQKTQLVVYNQGEEAIRDASLAFVLPNHSAFHVAGQLPKAQKRGKFVDRSDEEQASYPSVTPKDDAIHVSTKIGDIPAGEPVEVFGAPLRLFVGADLKGRKFGMRYTLFGKNLRTPAKGKLRLLFN